MTGQFDMVTLKNGAQVPAVMVSITYLTLQELLADEKDLDSLAAIYALIKYCRSGKRATGPTLELLASHALVGQDGIVNFYIKDIVLSVCEGDGFEIRLTSPLAGSA